MTLTWLRSDEVARVERLEFLDEKELVHQLFDHYCVTLGWANGTRVNFDEMKNINRYGHRQDRSSINSMAHVKQGYPHHLPKVEHHFNFLQQIKSKSKKWWSYLEYKQRRRSFSSALPTTNLGLVFRIGHAKKSPGQLTEWNSRLGVTDDDEWVKALSNMICWIAL